MLEIPDWVNQLCEAKKIDVLVCVDLREASVVRHWVEESAPGVVCCIIHVPLADKYIVFGLAQLQQEGPSHDSHDPEGK